MSDLLGANGDSMSAGISERDRHYDVTIERDVIAGITRLDVTGADVDGQVVTSLAGEVDPGDLELIGRLLQAIAATLAAEQRAARRRGLPARTGQAWTPDDKDHLADRYQDGASIVELANEFGRTERAIRFQLYQLGIGPFPVDGIRPREPRTHHEPAYTVAEIRKTHPNAYMPWTSEDDQRLAERAAQGATVAELMIEFGRNDGAIRARLGHVGHPTSITPAEPERHAETN